MTEFPTAVMAEDMPARKRKSNYPEPFAVRMWGREKIPLGDLFGLSNFGVNLARIQPGGSSALRHFHTAQDEFVYIVAGEPVLVTNEGETQLRPGMCAGFRKNSGNGHCLVNRTDREVMYLEMGDRSAGDEVIYPDEDLQALPAEDGHNRVFARKDGRAY